jgi:hypothetical protein
LFRPSLAVDFRAGGQWWLAQDEEERLEHFNRKHIAVNATRERLLDRLDLDADLQAHAPARSAIEVLKIIGIEQPTNPQCKDCAAVLRDIYGESKRNRGRDTWRVHFKAPETDVSALMDDSIY